jgi:hypothetical protein
MNAMLSGIEQQAIKEKSINGPAMNNKYSGVARQASLGHEVTFIRDIYPEYDGTTGAVGNISFDTDRSASAGMSSKIPCLKINHHVMRCPVCRQIYIKNNHIFYIIIVSLSLLLLILLKKQLNI